MKSHTKIVTCLNEFSYTPKIALIGKTGAGKSSLCNLLHGSPVAKTSDVEACTREVQVISVFDDSLLMYDFPGIGETKERDQEYAALYNDRLQEMDAIIWLIKADDKSFTTEEIFYENVIKPLITSERPLIFGISQCDKMNPIREWNKKEQQPSETQKSNLEAKRKEIQNIFKIPLQQIQYFSSEAKYRYDKPIVKALNPLQKSRYSGGGGGSFIDDVIDVVSFGACFITTATCKSLGKEDNCVELNTFRTFRDQWLIHEKDGFDLISEYYAIAPLIVSNIDQQENSDLIYVSVWNKYLQDAYEAIQTRELKKAKSIYIDMVKNLKQVYID